MVTKFKSFLSKSDLAKNTVKSYVWTVNYFLSTYGEVNKKKRGCPRFFNYYTLTKSTYFR